MTKENEKAFVRNLVSGLGFGFKMKMQTLLAEIQVCSFVEEQIFSEDEMFLWLQFCSWH